MTIEEHKQCKECFKVKPLYEFEWQTFNRDRHSCYCKECERKIQESLEAIN